MELLSSACHPLLGARSSKDCWGSICAQTHQLPLAYWLIPVSGCSWPEPSKRGGKTDGNTWHIPWVAKYPVAAMTWGQSVRRGLIQRAYLWCAQRQEQTIQATCHSVPPPKIQPMVPFTGKHVLFSGSPFSQVGWRHSLSPVLSPAHWPFKFPKPPSASGMSDIFRARLVSGLFSLFKYRQDVFLVVVL